MKGESRKYRAWWAWVHALTRTPSGKALVGGLSYAGNESNRCHCQEYASVVHWESGNFVEKVFLIWKMIGPSGFRSPMDSPKKKLPSSVCKVKNWYFFHPLILNILYNNYALITYVTQRVARVIYILYIWKRNKISSYNMSRGNKISNNTPAICALPILYIYVDPLISLLVDTWLRIRRDAPSA